MSSWYIRDRQERDLVRNTSVIPVGSLPDAEKHLERFPREDVSKGRYIIIEDLGASGVGLLDDNRY
jgi:hypothetical protein